MMLPSKVVCVGRNYAAHAKELGNAVPDSPVLFIKPSTSVVFLAQAPQGISIPKNQGECHFECEISVQIGATLKQASPEQAKAAIKGITLGLDLTLRDVQNELKEKAQPWEKAKAFDGACVLGTMLPVEMLPDLKNIQFSLSINGKTRQQGNSSDMLFDIVSLISTISHHFTLLEGDVIMTGTPAGVGALKPNDEMTLTLDTIMGDASWKTSVQD